MIKKIFNLTNSKQILINKIIFIIKLVENWNNKA